MRILTVEYRRLWSFGSYENETVGVVAEVGSDESAIVALQQAREWVDEQLGDEQHVEEVRQRLWQQESRLRELNGLIKTAGERFEYARKILAAHGIDVPIDHRTYTDEGDPDLVDLPF